MTSVVLVVASTFNAAWARGEVPPGLRAPGLGSPSVSGAFTITDVPDGDYVVLAAFENDNLVRDPDTAIGGTQIQRVTLGPASRQVALPASFKITEALAIDASGRRRGARGDGAVRPPSSGRTTPARTATPWSCGTPTATLCGATIRSRARPAGR